MQGEELGLQNQTDLGSNPGSAFLGWMTLG